ncbi:hypothetical protein PRUPE_6G221000 [Prunus persica]|uniref:Uncharacterized protein n=1 Tax=Prunus persica TaxID=3760 RepID=A0A251NTX3_PRUPE|nr:uncharacterized protein LOC18774907 isoform X2 [Prunus persica]ONI02772.1 hypothetical protein PRUPE_6G221000 [Prunus persica]
MGEFSSSSSSEGDGDSEWKAAINSAAAGASSVMSSFMNGFSANENGGGGGGGGGDYNQSKTQQLPKHYQIKAQKLLDEIIGKSLEIVNDPLFHLPDDEAVVDEDEGCIRLFKNAPPGIVFDHVDEKPLRKRPRILPGREINEKSKKFRRRLESVVVDGKDIMAAARDRSLRSLSRLEAKDEAAKAATKREEERVAQLKKIRGEKWLPCIAREMQLKR